MRRCAVAIGLAPVVLCAGAMPGSAAAHQDGAGEMQLAWQLSAPSATKEERNLLRREYRLSQASTDFWLDFDRLNGRIHESASSVGAMSSMIEGAPISAAPLHSLLAGLDAPAAVPEPAAARPDAVLAPPLPQAGMAWALLAAALLVPGFFLLRLLGAKSRRLRIEPAQAPPAEPVGLPEMTSPTEIAVTPPRQDGGEAAGLTRHTAPLPAEAPDGPADPVREELDHAMDLAEVMLSHGRTTGALQALKDYLQDHPDVSVRPWLGLLELYRQTGLREGFEDAAVTMHRHFNVKLPGWDEGIAGEPLRSFFDDDEHDAEILGLEQLPHILARIQATWPSESCLEYLRHLLADNRDGGRTGFPVSVVAEMLILEDILNDRLACQAQLPKEKQR